MKNISIYIKQKLHNFRKWKLANTDKMFTICIWAVLIAMVCIYFYMG